MGATEENQILTGEGKEGEPNLNQMTAIERDQVPNGGDNGWCSSSAAQGNKREPCFDLVYNLGGLSFNRDMSESPSLKHRGHWSPWLD